MDIDGREAEQGDARARELTRISFQIYSKPRLRACPAWRLAPWWGWVFVVDCGVADVEWLVVPRPDCFDQTTDTLMDSQVDVIDLMENESECRTKTRLSVGRSVGGVSNKGLEVGVMLRKRVAELGCGAPFSARLLLRTVWSTQLCSTSIATACRRGGPRESDHQDASSGCVWGPRLGIGAEQEERGEYRYCIPHPFFLWCSVLTLETPSDGRTQMFTTYQPRASKIPQPNPIRLRPHKTCHDSQLTTHNSPTIRSSSTSGQPRRPPLPVIIK